MVEICVLLFAYFVKCIIFQRIVFSTVKMHSVEELGTNVPAFLAKLWKIVEDPGTNELIGWSSVCNEHTVTNIAVIEPCICEANIYLLFSLYRV